MKMNDDKILVEKIQEVLELHTSNNSPKEKKKLKETLENALIRGIPIGESLGINEGMMEYLYTQAHHLFSLHKYKNSAEMFQVLYMFNPRDSRHALGIAASFQMNKEYDKAIGWYITLSIIDPESPLPYYYISDCFLKLNRKRGSLNYLKKAVALCHNKPNYGTLKARAEMMIESLKAELKNKGKEAAL